jgi:hypothetical protein
MLAPAGLLSATDEHQQCEKKPEEIAPGLTTEEDVLGGGRFEEEYEKDDRGDEEKNRSSNLDQAFLPGETVEGVIVEQERGRVTESHCREQHDENRQKLRAIKFEHAMSSSPHPERIVNRAARDRFVKVAAEDFTSTNAALGV